MLEPELQCPLLHHGLVHLYPQEISKVYAACVVLRETIEGDREWLDLNCRHVLPHSYGDVPTMNKYGTRCWYWDGRLHRGGDLPVVILADGSQFWYKYGKEHRDGDLPAMIHVDGSKKWCKDGECHRDGDLPAVIFADGSQLWYKDGQEQSRYWLIRRVCWYRAVIAKLV